MGRLDGKVAIVTGAGQGLGAKIAELFVKEGHKLGTKLLLPMIVMMGLTMVIVVIPAFMSM